MSDVTDPADRRALDHPVGTHPGRARDHPAHAPADRPALHRVRRDLLHDDLPRRRQGLAPAPRHDPQLRLHLGPDQARPVRRPTGLADPRRARSSASSAPTTTALAIIPPGVWNGMKGMTETAIVANCAHPSPRPVADRPPGSIRHGHPVRLGRPPSLRGLAGHVRPRHLSIGRQPWRTASRTDEPA